MTEALASLEEILNSLRQVPAERWPEVLRFVDGLRQHLTLGQLLEGATDENIHGEWDTGPSVGREVL